METLLTAKQASAKYGCSRATIQLWQKRGLLTSIESSKKIHQYKDSDIGEIVAAKHKKKNSCRRCGVALDISNRFSNCNICSACQKEYTRFISEKRRKEQPKKIAESIKASKLKTKTEVFRHYCGSPEIKCRCGFSDIRALSIDHINGGGTNHKKETGGSGDRLYCWLKRNGYPTGFQVLCMNCQFIKRHENKENSRYGSRKSLPDG